MNEGTLTGKPDYVLAVQNCGWILRKMHSVVNGCWLSVFFVVVVDVLDWFCQHDQAAGSHV